MEVSKANGVGIILVEFDNFLCKIEDSGRTRQCWKLGSFNSSLVSLLRSLYISGLKIHISSYLGRDYLGHIERWLSRNGIPWSSIHCNKSRSETLLGNSKHLMSHLRAMKYFSSAKVGWRIIYYIARDPESLRYAEGLGIRVLSGIGNIKWRADDKAFMHKMQELQES